MKFRLPTCSLSLLLPVLGAFLAACSGVGEGYSGYRQLPRQGWVYGDTVTFIPEHRNSLCRGRFVVAVRHDTSYPFSELWLELSSPGIDRIMRRDTLCFRLTDRHGNWTGHGIAASFQLTDTSRIFRHPTGVPVHVRHIMRADTIRGFNQLGLFFVPLE